jgi:hypothetical protein
MYIVFKCGSVVFATQMNSWSRQRPAIAEIRINPLNLGDDFVVDKIYYSASKWKAGNQGDVSCVDIQILEMSPDIRDRKWLGLSDD